MQKKIGVNIQNVGETTQFFGTQKQSNIGQFTYDLKKMKTYNLGKINIHVFFRGDICFTYHFLEDQELKQERSCEFWKKNSDLSDLTPDVRSYPVLRYLTNNLYCLYICLWGNFGLSFHRRGSMMLFYIWNAILPTRFSMIIR